MDKNLALETLKSFIEHPTDITVKDAIVVLHPELKESDDERIRKALINLISNDKAAGYTGFYKEAGITCDDAIAYLEKQKEQKPAEWSEEDEKKINGLYNAIILLRDLVHTGELKSTDRYKVENYYEELASWLKFLPERFNLQSKQEWGEGEKKVLDSIIDDYEKAAKSFCGYDGKIMLLKAIRDGEYDLSKQEWNEDDEEHINSILKRLEGMCKKGATFTRTRFAVSEDKDWLKSLRQQPKQEWSEEDKKMLNNTLDSLKRYQLSMPNFQVELQMRWLKSIRPQPHWKPSKKQMDALKHCVNGWQDTADGTLESLYNDLKKLI